MRLGNDHPSITPYGPVRTANGFILLAVGTDAQYARLVEVLGDDELSRSFVAETPREWPSATNCA